MGIDKGFAAMELLEQREVMRIAEPPIAHIGHERDAVGLQRIERVFRLAQAALDIEDRHRGEKPETAAMIGRLAGHELVPLPRHRAIARLIAGTPHRGTIRHRQDRRSDTALVHILKRDRRGPALDSRRAADAAAHQVEDRRRMMMDVDAVRLGHASLLRRMYYTGEGNDKEEERR